MGSQMIDGVGKIHLRNNSLGLFAGGFASVELAGTTKKVQAKRYTTAGQLLISDARISETTYELKISQEVFDIRGFELAMAEQAQVSASTSYYDFFEATVPTTGPYNIAAPSGVTFGTGSNVMVTMFSNGPWNLTTGNYGKLNLGVGTSTPAAGTFYQDNTGNQLTFNAAQAGAPIVVSYTNTVSNKLTIGKELSAVTGTTFEFSALLVSDEFPNGVILFCPQCAKTSVLSYKSADVASIENAFDVTVKSGFRKEFQLIQL